MKAILEIELIADNFFWHNRRGVMNKDFSLWLRGMKRLGPDKSSAWVAKILGFSDKFEFERKFIQGTKDFSQSNSVGSRGIYCYYPLDSGSVYEVNERTSWRKVKRYFVRVSGTEIEEISKEEVKKWLQEKIS